MNNNLGIGVMLNMLGGNANSVEIFQKNIGKEIKNLEIISNQDNNDDNALVFTFTDNSKMLLKDNGRSCCELRYMTTDDNLSEFIGAKLLGADIKEADNLPDEYGEHEVQFLEIKTSYGVFTCETHNEHNGYYGGFFIIAEEIIPE